jgi:gliding motility associated protien GldN
MKKILLFVILLGSSVAGLQAQNVLDGVYVKEHVITRRIIPYPFLREADVFWSKRIWRVIDLKEKINLPLRYPMSPPIKDRKSLIKVIMDAVNEGSLTAYRASDDEFTYPMTKTEVEGIGGSRIDTVMLPSPEPPYDPVPTVKKTEFSVDEVVAYRVKEDWVFDKQLSVMQPRIIGIAPLMIEKDDQGNKREGGQRVPLFWIYYPEARKLFVNNEVFNRGNDAERRTFDDIFTKRMFGSYIIKESNVYDRRIEEYRTGLDALLESQKIKDDIFNFEHDLWEQ